MFGLPLLQHFVTATSSRASGLDAWSDSLVIGSVLVLVVLGLWVLVAGLRSAHTRSRRSKRRPPGPRGQTSRRSQRPSVVSQGGLTVGTNVLIDGSNVMHWLDNTPQLAPLLQVVHDLSRRGLKPGIVFDANVGYKLMGKFMGEGDLSRLLSLPRDQILVVPKG